MKMLKVTSAILSLSFWIASCVLLYHYASTRPSRPDPQGGRIYAQRQIGVVFYLTSRERFIWRSLMIAGGGFFLLTAGLVALKKRLPAK